MKMEQDALARFEERTKPFGLFRHTNEVPRKGEPKTSRLAQTMLVGNLSSLRLP